MEICTKETLTETIFEHLVLSPGRNLRIEQLKKQYDVSTSRLRGALLKRDLVKVAKLSEHQALTPRDVYGASALAQHGPFALRNLSDVFGVWQPRVTPRSFHE